MTALAAAIARAQRIARDVDPVTAHVLAIIGDDHTNARAYIAAAIAECEDTRCPCGADELCGGVELPDRTEYRDALQAVLDAMTNEQERKAE